MTAREFGRRVRDARKAKGLSQQALADMTGLGKRTVQAIEAGENNPQRATRIALSEALELEGPGDREALFAEFSEPVQVALLIAGAWLEELDEVARLEWVAQFVHNPTNDGG